LNGILIMEIILSIFVGIGLAAAVGFRIFIPFLIVSIAAYTGNLQLSTYFAWIGTLPALILFAVATVTEIFSYYIPWVDNILDAINHPLAIFAGIILSGAVVTDFPPLIKWSLALIAGGGVAGTIHAATGLIRLKSSVVTGGIGNPVVSTAEAGSSIALSTIAIFIPAAAVIIVGAMVVYFSFMIKEKFLSPPTES
jgi:hypothetical protein